MIFMCVIFQLFVELIILKVHISYSWEVLNTLGVIFAKLVPIN